MRARRLLHDLRTRPAAAMLVVLAIALAAAIGGLGAGTIAQLTASTGGLFDEANAPHLVQMHAGEIDAEAVGAFAAHQPEVAAWAVNEFVGLDSAALALTPGTDESTGITEYGVTVQHDAMDVLLDAAGGPAAVSPGGIGVPVDIAADRGIELGDPITIGRGAEARVFTVEALIRDSIMSSPLASSRRLLVNEADLDAIRALGTGSEWLVEFELHDPTAVTTVSDAYLEAGLPSNGPNVDRGTFEIMAALTDGVLAAAVLAIAALLAVIAALILNITVRTAIVAETRQIGVLRAIGLPAARLRRLVLGTQFVLLAMGATLGAAIAAITMPAATGQVRLRLGGESTPLTFVAAVAVAALVFGAGALLARLTIRPALRRPPLDVMRAATPPRRTARRGAGRTLGAWCSLARAELRRSPLDHLAVLGIVLAATLMAALPSALHATMLSPTFMSSSGIAVSDLLIGLRHDDTQQQRLAAVERALRADASIERWTVLETVRVQAQDTEGGWTGMNVSSGDHTAFPLDYREGAPPTAPGELALSELNASSFGASMGDTVLLRLGEAEVPHTVVGIYRDITNGGRTAQALLPDGVGSPLWTVVLADTTTDAELPAIVQRYAALAAPARVTDVAAARDDIIGPLERATGTLATMSIAASAALVALLAGLLVHLFQVRGARRQSVMQAIGAPLSSLRAATVARIALPTLAGAAAGAALTVPAALGMVALAGTAFGATGLPIAPDPWLTGLGLPLLLVAAATIVAWFVIRRIPPSRVAAAVAGQEQ